MKGIATSQYDFAALREDDAYDVQLKNDVGSLRFLMITGVTKLTKLSLAP